MAAVGGSEILKELVRPNFNTDYFDTVVRGDTILALMAYRGDLQRESSLCRELELHTDSESKRADYRAIYTARVW